MQLQSSLEVIKTITLEWGCDCENAYNNKLTNVEMGGECLLRESLLMLDRADRVPGFLSNRPNWLPPTPASKFLPPFGFMGGGGNLTCGRGGGESNFGRLERKPGTLSTVWCTPSSVHPSTGCTILWYTKQPIIVSL
jgi:hypothetical protein